MSLPFRHDDQAAVMAELGETMPIICRESIEAGFHAYCVSRRADPNAQPDYTACTTANMLVDRITAVARDLVGAANGNGGRMVYRISPNLRATEILVGEHLAVRIKRTKQRRHGRSASYPTDRQGRIKSPEILSPGQMILPQLAGMVATDDGPPRLWLTAGYDLDAVEETLTRRTISVEGRRQVLWRWSLPELATDVIAGLSVPLADRVAVLRQARSA